MFLLRINGSLDLEVDDHMKAKIEENSLVQSMNMDASSLISGTSGVADDAFDEHLNDEMPPHIA